MTRNFGIVEDKLEETEFYKDKKGKYIKKLYFDPSNCENMNFIPSEDVISVSDRFFKKLLSIIQECYIKFGHIIDAEKYYTVENMKRLNKTSDDLEKELG